MLTFTIFLVFHYPAPDFNSYNLSCKYSLFCFLNSMYIIKMAILVSLSDSTILQYSIWLYLTILSLFPQLDFIHMLSQFCTIFNLMCILTFYSTSTIFYILHNFAPHINGHILLCFQHLAPHINVELPDLCDDVFHLLVVEILLTLIIQFHPIMWEVLAVFYWL